MSVITDIVSGIAGTIGKAAIDIRTAITGIDPATAGKLAEIAANLEAQKAKAETDLLQGQLDINKVEAASPSLFIAGWRPGLGWLIVAAMAMKYVLYPLATWLGMLLGFKLPDFPVDDGALYPLIVGMLGLGTMRSVEKVKGAAGNH